MHNFISVPFKTETSHGIAQVNGVAKFSPAGIVLEFEKKILGLISEGIKEARLSTADILDISFKKGFLSRNAKIEVRTRSLHALNGIPNNEGVLSLKVQARDIEKARDAVAKIQLEMNTSAAEALPTHTSLFDNSEDETQKLEDR
ncbi:MAG TPA: hypothetical protein PLP07_07550 [Pyrinomonadaceae bacterium]|nr:hypothetical protein [Chloracidobacterium sp.]MBP9936765.1 hypothetical protein [Pyrinomonadaceae bacterium]MBK7801868.1 hypothetical protein [Chloracidobacterium sp.]MBK9437987.1 hypothetical protein [Chloracidobacterium sp.]MBL0242174.1 hypothetical protein [Chloracidobacterium sp.]